jgi:hypothetical protein
MTSHRRGLAAVARLATNRPPGSLPPCRAVHREQLDEPCPAPAGWPGSADACPSSPGQHAARSRHAGAASRWPAMLWRRDPGSAPARTIWQRPPDHQPTFPARPRRSFVRAVRHMPADSRRAPVRSTVPSAPNTASKVRQRAAGRRRAAALSCNRRTQRAATEDPGRQAGNPERPVLGRAQDDRSPLPRRADRAVGVRPPRKLGHGAWPTRTGGARCRVVPDSQVLVGLGLACGLMPDSRPWPGLTPQMTPGGVTSCATTGMTRIAVSAGMSWWPRSTAGGSSAPVCGPYRRRSSGAGRPASRSIRVSMCREPCASLALTGGRPTDGW